MSSTCAAADRRRARRSSWRSCSRSPASPMSRWRKAASRRRRPRNVTYAEIQPILATHCAACHNVPQPAAPRRGAGQLGACQRRGGADQGGGGRYRGDAAGQSDPHDPGRAADSWAPGSRRGARDDPLPPRRRGDRDRRPRSHRHRARPSALHAPPHRHQGRLRRGRLRRLHRAARRAGRATRSRGARSMPASCSCRCSTARR